MYGQTLRMIGVGFSIASMQKPPSSEVVAISLSESVCLDRSMELLDEERVVISQKPHDDEMNEWAQKAACDLVTYLDLLKKNTEIDFFTKNRITQEAITILRVSRGFSEGLLHYTVVFTDVRSQDFAKEKRNGWRRYIQRMYLIIQEIALLIDRID